VEYPVAVYHVKNAEWFRACEVLMMDGGGPGYLKAELGKVNCRRALQPSLKDPTGLEKPTRQRKAVE